jgi:hypothetical protein
MMRRLIRPPVAAPGVRSACFLPASVCLSAAAGLFFPIWHLQLPPAAAGFCMAMSSVSVVTSSLLLRNYKPPAAMRPCDDYSDDMPPPQVRTGIGTRPDSSSRFPFPLPSLRSSQPRCTNSCVRVLACAVRGPFDLVCAARQPVPQAQGARVPARAERLPRAFLMTD